MEMAGIVSFVGGEQTSVMGLAGAGDLYVTCQAGRNSRWAAFSGAACAIARPKRIIWPDETVEGAELLL